MFTVECQGGGHTCIPIWPASISRSAAGRSRERCAFQGHLGLGVSEATWSSSSRKIGRHHLMSTWKQVETAMTAR